MEPKERKLLYLDRAKEETDKDFLKKFMELFGVTLHEWVKAPSTKSVEWGGGFCLVDENISIGLTVSFPERVFACPRAIKNGAKPIMDEDKQKALHEDTVASLNGVFSELFGVTYSAWSTSEYLKQRIRRSYF